VLLGGVLALAMSAGSAGRMWAAYPARVAGVPGMPLALGAATLAMIALTVRREGWRGL